MKLSGVRVLDLSQYLPGPYLTKMMADHGAEVVKVETPDGEPSRKMGTPMVGQTVYFRETQRNKKSIVLNLKTVEDREILMQLAAQSDVFVESFRPGVVDRLGIGYAAMCERAPGIVYCSISAFGQTGPLRERPAHDISIQAMTGYLALGCGADGAPVLPGVPAADMVGAMTALAGILMALLRRGQTGHGDYLDVAMLDSLLAWTPHFADRVFVHGNAPVPANERWWGGAPFYNIYRTSDGGHVTLGGTEPKFIENLLTALGRPDLISLAKQTHGSHQEPVTVFLAEVFATRTRDEWTEWFATRDVCYAPVYDLKEAYRDPQARARRIVLDDPEAGSRLGTPIKFAAEPGRETGCAPGLGEHTEEILASIRGAAAARKTADEGGVS